MKGGIAHWDDVEPRRGDAGHISGAWQNLGTAAGSVTVGVKRLRVDPGRWSTPVHVQGAEEEIFFVLGGAGISWQDGEIYEVGAGDCIVHTAGTEAHSLRAGPDGIDVLAFGMRIQTEIGYLPRAGVGWLGRTWVEAGQEPAPWAREVAAGEPEVGDPSPRPAWVVETTDVQPKGVGGERLDRDLGRAAGSERTGLRHVTLRSGSAGPPPHCHSAEEEIFVVLEGGGTLELLPSPLAAEHGATPEELPLRAGSVVARPAGTRVAHRLRAGEEEMTYLAYGTRDPNDMAYYPRSHKVFFRGLGVIALLEHLDYMDGEA